MAFRNGYGLGVFGGDLFGIDSKLVEGAAATSSAGTATTSAERVRLGAASAQASSTASTQGFITIAGAVAGSAESSAAVDYLRIRNVIAATSANSNAVVNSRIKWIDIAPPTTTWTSADYREGAA